MEYNLMFKCARDALANLIADAEPMTRLGTCPDSFTNGLIEAKAKLAVLDELSGKQASNGGVVDFTRVMPSGDGGTGKPAKNPVWLGDHWSVDTPVITTSTARTTEWPPEKAGAVPADYIKG